MDQRNGDINNKDRNRRPIRTKRCNRRAFGEDRRPVKRLFTPEIKRFLKDWLVRRRDNPYPNREEKKSLSIQTGLTYIQVCNWFANWRRKLKNAGKEPQKKTWGNLIKTYNNQAQGNVEHFSICSDDSIWQEMDPIDGNTCESTATIDHSYISEEPLCQNNNNGENQQQCFYVTSTTEADSVELNSLPLSGNKYKNHIMEKYLRDCQKPLPHLHENYEENNRSSNGDERKPQILDKWLESAEKFRPSENNYLNWTFGNGKIEKKISKVKKVGNEDKNALAQQHGREELDAAEALTRLANIHAMK